MEDTQHVHYSTSKKKTCTSHKLELQNYYDLIDACIPKNSMVKVRDQNSNRRMVKQTAKTACATSCVASWSCKVKQPIQNVHDQSESLHGRPTAANTMGAVECKIIFTASNSWRLAPMTSDQLRLCHSYLFWLDLVICLTLFLFKFLTSDFYHRALRQKSTKIRDDGFWSVVAQPVSSGSPATSATYLEGMKYQGTGTSSES